MSLERKILTALISLAFSADAAVAKQGIIGGTGLTATAPFTATGGTAPISSADRASQIANIADWGATTSSPDNTAAFTAALAAGKRVFVPAGIYFGCKITIPSNADIEGSGQYLTTIKATPGCNGDVFVGANAYSLFGTNSSAGANAWGISDLTIDGNKANQAAPGGGTNDQVNGIAAYSASFRLRNVLIQNVLGNGLRTEWYQYGSQTGGEEAYLYNVTIDTVGRHGWWFKGPHDSDTHKLVIIDAGQEADNTYSGIYQEGNGNGRFFDVHPWHRSTTTNRMKWDVSSNGSSEFINSHFEGARGWFEHRGNGDLLSNNRFYGSFGAANTAMEIFLGSNNSDEGNSYSQPNGNQYAIQFGDATHQVGNNSVKGGSFTGFSALTPFKFVNDGGYNTVDSVGYDVGGGATAFGGTVNPCTYVSYKQGGTLLTAGFSLPSACATLGVGAVDLQVVRTNVAHSASGASSATLGFDNTASGYGSIAIGYQNTATQYGSCAIGTFIQALGTYSCSRGYYALDRYRQGADVYSGGKIVTPGDSQFVNQLLFGAVTLSTSTTVTVRVTSDGLSASSVNVDNIPSGVHYHLQISGSCTDTSAGGNVWASWDPAYADLDYKSSLTYAGAFSSSTAATRNAGAFSGASLIVSADGTNKGVNATFTLPAGATADTAHCVATATSLQEVQ